MLKISLALFLAVCAPASAQAPQRKQGAPPVRTQPTAGRGAVTRQPPVLGDDISRLIDRFSSAGGLKGKGEFETTEEYPISGVRLQPTNWERLFSSFSQGRQT